MEIAFRTLDPRTQLSKNCQRLCCGIGRQGRMRSHVPCQAGSNSGTGASASGDNLSEKLQRVRRRLGLPTDGSSNGTTPPQGGTDVGVGEWGAQSWYEDWDPSVRFSPPQVERIADEGVSRFRKETRNAGPRDKWITPLLDWDAVREGLDLDQERSEQMLTGEALVNKEESQLAVRYVARLIGIPLVTGFVVSRALADPILNFSLRNNPDAFELSEIQKYEGAKAVHVEETRLRLDMAIGRLPPMTELQMFEHLAEFAAEVQEEERHHNETILINAVSDSISFLTFVGILSQPTRSRDAMYNTMARLFYGLSDIAKAVMIILVADTLLGYHSEEGWHGLIELVLGHYGVEPSEEGVVIFVGIVPVVIDVLFKYWIFIGLNRISPGAVVTIKQVDRH
ncbi:hypothetical protein VOLCADRAFT_86170 [Volvox carteri f. nagariensis]|uniref:Chloroplast envelope membrane protein n=1 Tax=Volvox carteri f. nagariensis TaxID=3068 RepID=D8TI22_VOLCA|nr:uncharacterized protein VOLCADRAFT_86170 [Volvox carteri f. nagariensis]EFJ52816.1 hypothetical protein VOLCADRAFT_86170 [Volvox carteri f. nagariensis]|eukprot:XP_002945821.1 hypothetical protein VOLCADRAFT_86170 [Volvox carteri f. nagariensis]